MNNAYLTPRQLVVQSLSLFLDNLLLQNKSKIVSSIIDSVFRKAFSGQLASVVLYELRIVHAVLVQVKLLRNKLRVQVGKLVRHEEEVRSWREVEEFLEGIRSKISAEFLRRACTLRDSCNQTLSDILDEIARDNAPWLFNSRGD